MQISEIFISQCLKDKIQKNINTFSSASYTKITDNTIHTFFQQIEINTDEVHINLY